MDLNNESKKKKSNSTFNYIFTCDIEDSVFRVKIGNLDGILPSTANNQKSTTPSRYINVENNYDYNIVEDMESFDIEQFFPKKSIDKELKNKFDEVNYSGIESDKQTPMVVNETKSFDTYSDQNAENQNFGLTSKEKKEKLSEIIFGSLKQPFRALSINPYLTCDLVSSGRRLCPFQQTQYKQMKDCYEWNEWLVFPLSLDTMPRDTIVCFTVWDTIGPGKTRAVARTSISLFSKRGCLRKGIYDLRLFFNEDCEEYYTKNYQNENIEKSESIDSTKISLNEINFTDRTHRNKSLILPENELIPILRKHLKLEDDIDKFSKAAKASHTRHTRIPKNFDFKSYFFTSTTQYHQSNLDYYPSGTSNKSHKIHQLKKLKKLYQNNQIPKIDWLDRLAFLQIERDIVKDKSMSSYVYLTIEFPTIVMDGIEQTVVYFEDKDNHCCQFDIINGDIVTVPDPEINLPNLVEIKHHALARSARSGIALCDLRPNATIRNQLNAIVNYPSTQQLSNEEQDLLWRFRFYLRNQKKAFAKFLKTVNWNSESEAEQAIDLMKEWAPMDIEDSLELLSAFFTHPAVRRYAVGRLKEAADEELVLYLLQLVQALKYENFKDIKKSFEKELLAYQQEFAQTPTNKEKKYFSESISSSDNPVPESMKIFASTPNLDATINSSKTLISSKEDNEMKTKSSSAINQDDLATFLINRACENDELANHFFWYLCVECEGAKSLSSSIDLGNEKIFSNLTLPSVMSSAASSTSLIPPPLPHKEFDNIDSDINSHHSRSKAMDSGSSFAINSVTDMYMIILKRFSTRLLCGTPEMVARRSFLLRQQDFVVKLVEIMKEVARESGNRLRKIEKLQSILDSPEPQFRFNFSKKDPLPSPLNPNIRYVGVAAKEAMLYKSATMPAKIGFLTTDGNVFYTIFKNGDDLRQDDLILQMINLMDKLLRKENLDLKLTPYKVLACSSKHGFVQFIDSLSIAEIISNEGSIQSYLRKISRSSVTPIVTSTSSVNDFQLISTGQTRFRNLPSSPQSSIYLAHGGVSPEIMDTYIKSCAGYCVITYLLGVGDRHLDNLMLTKTGRLFHIDFGFILGRDPKVRPPPMKITREMVDAMGGMDSDNFSKFCSLVRTAFLHLRRHANLILNLFSLMIDANVPDIALEPDKCVQKVQDKFKLELDDEQADHYITEQVEYSVRSIMPVVVDQLHKMTQI
ncbi:phosphatidylinositol 3-kinase catalytic subunit type 3-like protein [Sarcoptes scabiei]|uniref:Phosphatidylinositol 3-kinase catalytic subunit type 3 n=1 Tax=Sarcoptes scabiei TaxID=52283 RepID=A0A131ZZ49_SARSC|nr:phosphatidylinositol 3-kinase catalytic subunit type 3-like protein [Sarcoptes scabiei]